jgi:hypothetical protein
VFDSFLRQRFGFRIRITVSSTLIPTMTLPGFSLRSGVKD